MRTIKAKFSDPWSPIEEGIRAAMLYAWDRKLYKHVECKIEDKEKERIIDEFQQQVLERLKEIITIK